MSLLNPPQYDASKGRRRTLVIWTAITAVIILAALVYFARDWPYEHTVSSFFSAIEQQEMDKAYGIYMADPEWKSHPDKYKTYPYGQFVLDWGPSGDWGAIKSHHVECAGRIGSGVIVKVRVNDRAERAFIWVEKKDRTLTVAPSQFQLQCGGLFAK
jgi:hypothetical protein